MKENHMPKISLVVSILFSAAMLINRFTPSVQAFLDNVFLMMVYVPIVISIAVYFVVITPIKLLYRKEFLSIKIVPTAIVLMTSLILNVHTSIRAERLRKEQGKVVFAAHYEHPISFTELLLYSKKKFTYRTNGTIERGQYKKHNQSVVLTFSNRKKKPRTWTMKDTPFWELTSQNGVSLQVSYNKLFRTESTTSQPTKK